MFCSECGKQVKDDAKFCGECGAAQIVYTLKYSAANSDIVPVNITIAIRLNWLSTLMGVFDMFNSAKEDESGIVLFIVIFMVCLAFWMNAKLREGKNWMRLFMLIVSVLGTFVIFTRTSSGGLIALIGVVFSIVILSLLYSASASAYFKAKSNN